MTDYYETKSQPITKLMVWQAYKKVKANKGSSGIDRMSWEDLDKDLSSYLYKLWNRLTSGSYFPLPVKQVKIPKKDGGIRKLGVPTLLDRIAQQVVRAYLERQLEPLFHESSFGYRPNRNAHQAVKQSERNCFGHDFVVDLDIKGFFDNINHGLMMKALRYYCKDEWIALYVSRWLNAGIMADGVFEETKAGTPQGGVVSPLLANLYLHVAFDEWMRKYHPEKPFERYADDVVIHCKTEKQAQFMLRQVRQRMKTCFLELHPEKTKIVNLRGWSDTKYPRKYDFLGFTIKASMQTIKGKGMLLPGTFVSIKSRTSILGKFREMQIHKWRKPIKEVANRLNPVIRGLLNYYHKLRGESIREIWNQLNHRLLKWVKWEKGLFKWAAVRWLKQQYKSTPNLFEHWKLVQP
ncbi:group II intron reverse transcriptase/maturase [Aquiflexum balticum DSM 16537]|uniref:RNA-directed DNA polymerase n=1 Tax=Aquiflexum balticum DSM 16537 TaxID=758820 RepID=A0A1W2H5R7_9BACT|nr:group II intron reverse transcriptase/maturase [Aquiflexum balticum]SMD42524.1 group II intron reverse transcriptase/maturase [Aquiflexum balticum DSM 16537]SMD42533.1 group II intron reverse transcriptase/maturase [Aquiflexum balticum DSM 16537]SMD44166.1 group II intron reverse transcriptase/maturase [Aquiflexum balticum DSM 16537]SMD44170.1 group II intron reverse transcriptase/maturase [Aquiflexum balticum DSM 16537]SMD44176.1 group II intron reverse transcriptase/maturase [Aquiflexum b